MGRHSVRTGRYRTASITAAVLGLGALAVAPAQAATTAPQSQTQAQPQTQPQIQPQAQPAGDATALVPGTPCTVTAKACVDLAHREAWLIVDGKVSRGPVRMMPGDRADPTPVGTFTVQWKDQNHISDMPNHAPMPFSVFFADGGVAFHEGSLQNPSYGCVHLTHDDAVAFFDYLQVGDQVQVH
ncbi:L,D-transpeptidase [Pseudonocardia ailaonensis]